MSRDCVIAFLLILAGPLCSSAQPQYSFEAGGMAGIPTAGTLKRYLTGAASFFSHYEAADARYLAGPSFAFIVDDRAGVEVDFLYKPFDIRQGFTGAVSGDSRLRRTETFTEATSWETAVLIRYAFTNAPARPFVTGGISFQRFSGENETRVLLSVTGEEISRTRSSGPINPDGHSAGFVFGGGAEMRLQHIRIAPEFRYIRRNNDSPQNGYTVIPSNQYEFLLGLSCRFF